MHTSMGQRIFIELHHLQRRREKVCRVIHLFYLFATPWAVACQAPLSMGFSRQEYWSGLVISYSRGSSRLRDWTPVSAVSCFGRRIPLPLSHRGSPSAEDHVINITCDSSDGYIRNICPFSISGLHSFPANRERVRLREKVASMYYTFRCKMHNWWELALQRREPRLVLCDDLRGEVEKGREAHKRGVCV